MFRTSMEVIRHAYPNPVSNDEGDFDRAWDVLGKALEWKNE